MLSCVLTATPLLTELWRVLNADVALQRVGDGATLECIGDRKDGNAPCDCHNRCGCSEQHDTERASE